MRALTVTILLSPKDGAFDLLTNDAMMASVKSALLRGYPLLRESELALEFAADVYDPPDAECE